MIGDFEKELLHRDIPMEQGFKSKFSNGMKIANDSIIPIMKHFGMDITLDNVLAHSTGQLRKQIAEYEASKRIKQGAPIFELIEKRDAAFIEFDKYIAKFVSQSETMKKYDEVTERYRNKVDTDEDFYPISFGGTRRRRNLPGSEVAEIRSRRRGDEVERLQEGLMNALQKDTKLQQIRDFLVLDGDTLKFEDEKVKEQFAVYCTTEKEFIFVQKLMELADMINSVFKGRFNHRLDFGRFFKYDEPSGNVVISDKITKGDLEAYCKRN